MAQQVAFQSKGREGSVASLRKVTRLDNKGKSLNGRSFTNELHAQKIKFDEIQLYSLEKEVGDYTVNDIGIHGLYESASASYSYLSMEYYFDTVGGIACQLEGT